MQRCKIMHLIGQLDRAGTETVLLQLLQRANRRRFDMEVVQLIDGGELLPQFAAAGISVSSLGMRRGVPDPWAVFRLRRLLRERKPQLLATWMYHSNLVGSIAAGARLPVVWNIHNTQLNGPGTRTMTRWVAKACGLWSSRAPQKIVYVSRESRRVHERSGYHAQRGLVIPNGFDTAKFSPDPTAGPSLRNELGIPSAAPMIGHAGRFHPHKDHRNLIEAARIVVDHRPNVHFVLCGPGVDRRNAQLADWIVASGLTRRVHLLGQRDDMPRLQAAFDLAISASSSEAFPLAVGEAMASATPSVVTDVGDSALLVGDTGAVAPPHDPLELARGCLRLLALPAEDRRRLGQQARRRVARDFEIGVIAERYYELWEDVAGQSRRRDYSATTPPARRAA